MNLQSQLSVLLLVLSKDDCKISVSFKLIQSFKLGNGKQLKKKSILQLPSGNSHALSH
jgi:hypothetical protein